MVTVLDEWLDAASDEEIANFLGPAVSCPRCEHVLLRDLFWSRPYYADDRSHTYSNMRVLVHELRRTGKLPRGATLP
jgi:hypothetical protein